MENVWKLNRVDLLQAAIRTENGTLNTNGINTSCNQYFFEK